MTCTLRLELVPCEAMSVQIKVVNPQLYTPNLAPLVFAYVAVYPRGESRSSSTPSTLQGYLAYKKLPPRTTLP